MKFTSSFVSSASSLSLIHISGAEVLEALLTNDEVNFANGVATIVGAYNRPAPPSPIAVWSWDGTNLRNGDRVLQLASSETTELGDSTTYR